MAKKTLSYTVVGAVYTNPGVELAAGDEATIFLDQSRNSNLPASIPAIVQTVTDVNVIGNGNCADPGKKYLLEYDTEDLPESVSSLAACDVDSITGTACCNALRESLDEVVETLGDIQDDLDTWDMVVLAEPPVDGAAGVQQEESQTAVGTILTDGTLIATVTADEVTGSPVAVTFNVDAGDVPAVWAAKAAAAMGANAAIAEVFTDTHLGTAFGLKQITPTGNDGTLNIAIAAGTATGITPDAASDTVTVGVAAGTPDPVPARVGQRAKWGNRTWVALDLYTWVEEINEFTGITDYGFTSLIGGTAADLDSLEVSPDDVGRQVIGREGGGTYFYRLTAGTTAENSPYFIRPDNYSSPDNEVYWFLTSMATTSAYVLDASTGGNGVDDELVVVKYGVNGVLTATGFVEIVKDGTGFSATFSVSNITADRALEAPDAAGTLAVQRTVTLASPGTGVTITVARYVDQVFYLTPAGTIATHTFTLPAAADSRVGQKVELLSSQIITALTVNAAGGGSVVGTALTAAAANVSYEFVCTAAGTWLRLR